MFNPNVHVPKSSQTPLPLDLHDRLAVERTRLTNERIVLAYLRSALTLIIAGFSLMLFFRDNLYVWVGALLVPLGVGVARWLRYRSKRARIEAQLLSPAPTHGH